MSYGGLPLLSHHVVTEITKPFQFQGYHVFCDNFYSSPALFRDLLDSKIYTIGTLRVDRKDVHSIYVGRRALSYNRNQFYELTDLSVLYSVAVIWRILLAQSLEAFSMK